MTDSFKILLVATEAVPFVKEGGVGDVIGSLPKELAALGHDVRVFLPRYGSVAPTHGCRAYGAYGRLRSLHDDLADDVS